MFLKYHKFYLLPKSVEIRTTLRFGGVSKKPFDGGSGKLGLNLGLNVGDSYNNVIVNRKELYKKLPSKPVWLNQVHGSEVIDISNLSINSFPTADSSFTYKKNIICVILSADCFPILISDTKGKVVGAIHGGWKSISDGIIEKTILTMRNYCSDELIVWIGPGITSEHYEVGEDFYDVFLSKNKLFKKAFKKKINTKTKFFADLPLIIQEILTSLNIKKICNSNYCTFSNNEKFFSYRKEKKTGRMASMIWIK
tara:strand:- start:12 stop:770 length:759 start_codon:yes stop_codon:yes gene_type:complete